MRKITSIILTLILTLSIMTTFSNGVKKHKIIVQNQNIMYELVDEDDGGIRG